MTTGGAGVVPRDAESCRAWAVAAGLADVPGARRVIDDLAGLGLPEDLFASLCTRLATLLPGMADADRVLVHLVRFLASVRSPLATVALFERDAGALGTLLRIFAASPYLAEIVIADPEAWEQVRVGQGRPEAPAHLAAALAAELPDPQSDDLEAVRRGLRRFKRRQVLRIAYGDIVVGQRLETVVSQISHLADTIIAAAAAAALGRVTRQRGTPREPDGRPATLAVVALGKLGGGELNYSSDVDLVCVHSADGRVEGPRGGTNQEFFERVVREMVRLLSEASPDGAAYRVDLRLRPYGSAGPPSLPLDAMLRYFDEQGRTWERQAWVKARCVAGDAALGRRLLAGLEPWIYRRWLSRADIGGIKALKRRMEQRALASGTAAADVKHGHGGIRDIEFTIQFLQLLGGGDAPRVRTAGTLDAIRRLAESGALTDQERAILERTYTLLRTVEHRLQILADRQTHRLPADPGRFSALAARLGYGADEAARERLQADLAEATQLNRRILDHLLHDAFPDDPAPEPEADLVLDPDPEPQRVADVLARYGFHDVAAAHRLLVSLAEEPVRFLSTRRCRHFLAAIAGRLLAAVGRTPDPDAAFRSLAAVADSVGGKAALWELFSSHPATLELTVRLCASSPFLANLLVGNPGMVDELLDSLLVGRLPDPATLDAGLAELCRGAAEIDPIVHSFKVAQQLRVGVRDIVGRQDTEEITSALTAIAEATVRTVVGHEETRLAERLGAPRVGTGGDRAGSVVLAMGKFGGREMNYASDVDVVFLYDHDGSTSPRRRGGESVTNAHFFSELAQRVARAFNQSGPQGRLYEMDSRLRPSGRAGAATLSLDEFARYFAVDGPAAVWERQALTKARPVVGTAAARTRVAAIVEAAAYGRIWTAADVESIRQMRYRMEEGARPANLKRGPGGVVDIEFVVQMLQLVHGGADPRLRGTGTLSGLVHLHAAGHVPAARFRFLEDAYRLLRSIEGRLRLVDAVGRHEFPAAVDERRRLAHLLGRSDAEALAAEVRGVTGGVRQAFEETFSEAVARLG